MLRNGRLLHLQSIHNLPHRPLLQGQVVEYLSPPWLRHSIKSVGSGCRPCHDRTIHAYMGICQALFFSSPFLAPVDARPPPRSSAHPSSERYLFFCFFPGTFSPVATLPLVEAQAALHARRAPSSRSTLGVSPAHRHERHAAHPRLPSWPCQRRAP